MGVVSSYAVLVGVQAALVVAPARPRRLASSRALGLVIPGAALIAGVSIARAAGGAALLAALATVAAPVLAAAAGWARGWRLPLVPLLVVAALYLLAWRWPGTLAGQGAATALIAGACLAVTGLVAGLAPSRWLALGLVGLVALDIVLVWGDRQVAPTMRALSAARPPVADGRPLPSLQQVEFGSVSMGWLDLAAPALLGLLVCRRGRAAIATGVGAGLWGLLLIVTSPIAATPPVLIGLLAGGGWQRSPPHRRRRPRLPGQVSPRGPGVAPGWGGHGRRPSAGATGAGDDRRAARAGVAP